MMSANRVIIAAMGDSHAGHKLGLCNPDEPYQDEGPEGEIIQVTPALSETQMYLWHDIYIPGIKAAYKLANGDPIVLFHLGDQTQAFKHPDAWMSTAQHAHMLIARNNWLPWFQAPNVLIVRSVYGTAAHNGGQGSYEVMITELLRRQFPDLDIGIAYHYLLDLNGAGIDLAHHGAGAGLRSWLRGNVSRFYLRDLMLEELIRGKQPPKLVLRGHYHTYVREFLEQAGHESWLVVVPSLCGMGEFARQVTRSTFQLTNGIVLVEFVNGKIQDIILAGREIDIRTKEQIEL